MNTVFLTTTMGRILAKGAGDEGAKEAWIPDRTTAEKETVEA
jgi:hypothetical protein